MGCRQTVERLWELATDDRVVWVYLVVLLSWVAIIGWMIHQSREVQWAGMPMVSDGGEGWGHLHNVELGLRADGTMVWRKKER